MQTHMPNTSVHIKQSLCHLRLLLSVELKLHIYKCTLFVVFAECQVQQRRHIWAICFYAKMHICRQPYLSVYTITANARRTTRECHSALHIDEDADDVRQTPFNRNIIYMLIWIVHSVNTYRARDWARSIITKTSSDDGYQGYRMCTDIMRKDEGRVWGVVGSWSL